MRNRYYSSGDVVINDSFNHIQNNNYNFNQHHPQISNFNYNNMQNDFNQQIIPQNNNNIYYNNNLNNYYNQNNNYINNYNNIYNNNNNEQKLYSPQFFPNLSPLMPSSPHGSDCFNLNEENNILQLRLPVKRVNSSQNIKKNLSIKSRQSLFMNNEKEEKIDEVESIQSLMNNINLDFCEFVKTQKGSRILQKLLNKILPNELDLILEKIKDNFSDLMTDTYGNYFCQKIIQSCSAEQRIFILKNLKKVFTSISCHPSGTHAIQTLIEIINMPGEEELVKECVKDNILKLSYVIME